MIKTNYPDQKLDMDLIIYESWKLIEDLGIHQI